MPASEAASTPTGEARRPSRCRVIAGVLAASAVAPLIVAAPLWIIGIKLLLQGHWVGLGVIPFFLIPALVLGMPLALGSSVVFALPAVWIGRRLSLRGPVYFAAVGAATILAFSAVRSYYNWGALRIGPAYIWPFGYSPGTNFALSLGLTIIAGALAGVAYWCIAEMCVPPKQTQHGS